MTERAKSGRISVVVSAVAGVSNSLQAAIDGCVEGKQPSVFIDSIRKTHADICAELHSVVKGFDAAKVMQSLQGEFEELERLLAGVTSFGECPKSIHCRRSLLLR